MSSTSLVQSTSNNSLSRSTSSQNQTQSPATKAKNAVVHPLASLTPQKGPATSSAANNASPAVSTPGRWQHPRMDEIVRRQNASCFNPADARIVVLNIAIIILSFFAKPYISSIPIQAIRNTSYLNYTFYTVWLGLLANILITSYPLLCRPDACEDIPLTDQQRHAFGLPPMSRPATPQEQAQYVTPPRYSRSATPRSSVGSAGSFADSMRVQARASPLSGRGSPLDSSVVSPFGSARRGSGSGSPFSASPLKDKVLSNSELGRRGSLGSSRGSPLGGDFDGFGSPSAKKWKSKRGTQQQVAVPKGKGEPGDDRQWMGHRQRFQLKVRQKCLVTIPL